MNETDTFPIPQSDSGLSLEPTKLKFNILLSPHALLDLLNRIVKPENPFVEVEYLNTEVAPDAQGAKAVRLDLLVRCKSGRVVGETAPSCSSSRRANSLKN